MIHLKYKSKCPQVVKHPVYTYLPVLQHPSWTFQPLKMGPVCYLKVSEPNTPSHMT